MTWRRFFALLAIVVSATIVGVQTYVSHTDWAAGRDAPRRLTLLSYPALDPNVHLSMESKDVTVSFNVNGKRLDNLLVSDNSLTNTGKTRIEPEDFDRPISVTVVSPWQIVTVENSPFAGNTARLEWEQASPREFRAKPSIINAGETIFFAVFVTKPPEEASSEVKPLLSWDVHGRNLSGFTPAPEENQSERYSKAYGEPSDLRVELIGWAIPLAIALGALGQASYLILLYLIGWLRSSPWVAVPLVVALTIVSYCGAEATVTYLIDSPTSVMNGGVSNVQNAPIIAVELILLIVLGRKALRRTRAPSI